MVQILTRLTVCLLASALMACSRPGDEVADSQAIEHTVTRDAAEVEAVIEARLQKAFAEVWAGEQNAERFVRDFFTGNAVVISSDGPSAWSGDEELIPLIDGFMQTYPGITAEPIYTRLASETVAYQFAQFHFLPADPAGEVVPAKSLYVWIKEDGQWKIAADHFSYTLMDTPSIAQKGVSGVDD